MKHILIVFTLFAATAVFAQDKNPVTSVVKEILPRQQKNLVAAVEEMPADKFGFHPTPPQMTFGHLVLHIIESNNYLCAKISDVPELKPTGLKDTDEKDKLVAALKASFDFCTTALARFCAHRPDQRLGRSLQLRRDLSAAQRTAAADGAAGEIDGRWCWRGSRLRSCCAH
jgi:hypothetical protein